MKVNDTTQPEYSVNEEPTTSASKSVDEAVPVAKSQDPIQEDAMAAEMNYSKTADAPTAEVKDDGAAKAMSLRIFPLVMMLMVVLLVVILLILTPGHSLSLLSGVLRKLLNTTESSRWQPQNV